MSDRTVEFELGQSTSLETQTASNEKAVIIGIYGVPGSGKTFLLGRLKLELDQEVFAFYEGSEVISNVVPGGLSQFQAMEEQDRVLVRQQAIDSIKQECINSGKTGIVVGHFMFWSEEETAGHTVITKNDLSAFTHVLYLNTHPETIARYRLHDTERKRPSISVAHLHKWQEAEITQLLHHCRHQGILFSVISPDPTLVNKVSELLRDFNRHTEKLNLSYAEITLDETLSVNQGQLETMLVLDADRTLCAEDTGALFWGLRGKGCPLKELFSGPLGHSYTAFRQAALLYEDAANDEEFDALCQDVARSVVMYPAFISLLRLVAEEGHVRAVIVTCGLRRVWDKVLEREGLSGTVKVIGGGRISDGLVITAAVKGSLVARLRDVHHMYVWAFGDSPLDLKMLSIADRAIVVVGEQNTRSKTMDAALVTAIDNEGFRGCQVVVPGNAPPRLDTTKLPLVRLTGKELFDSIFSHRSPHVGVQTIHATDRSAAKILATPMRDATISGPVLRGVHRRVGWYLAIEFVTKVIGLEECLVPHVQGHNTIGHQLFHEKQTLIVALMRGGEPMALGVSDAFPLAMFVHANSPNDIKIAHLENQLNVILVDSVVNSGKTVIQFVQHIRTLHASVRIVIVAGVVQAELISGFSLARALVDHTKPSIVALRLSDNKYSGRGTTDTGNRLFNTTDLP